MGTILRALLRIRIHFGGPVVGPFWRLNLSFMPNPSCTPANKVLIQREGAECNSNTIVPGVGVVVTKFHNFVVPTRKFKGLDSPKFGLG